MDRKLSGELNRALKIDVSDVRGNRTQNHREQMLIMIHNMQTIQRPKKRIGFFEFVLRQIPFMGKDLWMTQGFAAFAMFGVLYLSLKGELRYLTIHHIPMLLGILAIAMVMISIPLVLRPYRYQMYEIEMASRLSLPRLLTVELMLLTTEYLAVFAFCVWISTRLAGLTALRVTLYFQLPLIMAGTGCVQIIRRTREWEEISRITGMCEGYCVGLAAVLIVLYRMKPELYANIGLWTALAVLTIPLLILSIHMWIKDSAVIDHREEGGYRWN